MESNVETYGAKALTWALIVGAALLLVEITWAPSTAPATQRAATVQTITVANGDTAKAG